MIAHATTNPLDELLRSLRKPLGAEPLTDVPTVVSYAAIWNVPTHKKNGFSRLLRRGSIRPSLDSGRMIEILVEHDSTQRVLSSITGRLALHEDDFGLFLALRLPDSALGRDVADRLRGFNLRAMSIGYDVLQHTRPMPTVKDITVAKLNEVSLCEAGNQPAALARFVDHPGEAEREYALRRDDQYESEMAVLLSRGNPWDPSIAPELQRVATQRARNRLAAL